MSKTTSSTTETRRAVTQDKREKTCTKVMLSMFVLWRKKRENGNNNLQQHWHWHCCSACCCSLSAVCFAFLLITLYRQTHTNCMMTEIQFARTQRFALWCVVRLCFLLISFCVIFFLFRFSSLFSVVKLQHITSSVRTSSNSTENKDIICHIRTSSGGPIRSIVHVHDFDVAFDKRNG